MKYYIFLSICVLATVASADPMRYPYWQMIKEIVGTIESQPPPPVTISDSNLKTNVEYPFELLRHLRVSDLLMAAVEGASEARLQAALGKSPAEIDSLVRQNVALALEYMPMLIRDEDDLEEIALLMSNRDSDNVLRYYLIQNLSSELAPQSFLSLSLHEITDANDSGHINPSRPEIVSVYGHVIDTAPEAFKKSMLEMASQPLEDPVIQYTVMKIYDARLYQKYKTMLENIPEVKEIFASSSSQDIFEFVKANPVEFSVESNLNLKRCRGQFHDFAFAIAGHISEGSVRDEQVKALTKEILEKMRDTVLGINVEILNNFLAGKPFDSTPFPKVPGESEPSTGIEGLEEDIPLDELLKRNFPQN